MVYGVVDVGSNTVRLCVYDVDQKRRFKTIMNRKTMAGLAAYIVDEALTDEGIAEAVQAIRKCLKRASYLNPSRVDVFATAVLRNISNSQQAIARIQKEAACKITLLSDADEAHLGFVGASAKGVLADGALIDIGGGSTEVTHIEGGVDVQRTSLPVGSLSSYKGFVADILPTQAEVDAIRAHVRGLIAADASGACEQQAAQLYGVGGSIRALAEVNALLREGAPDDELTREDVEALAASVAAHDKAFIDAVVHAAPERLHTIGCGCAVLLEVFETLGGQHLQVCEHGVREGYLLERMLK